MGTTPTTTNTAADTADEVVYDLIYDVAVKAAIAYCQAQLPFLAWPVFSQIFTFGVNKIGGVIYKYLSQVVTFAVIDIQIATEKEAYMTAEGALRAALLGSDPAAITAAQAQFQQALGSLIHYDGSSTS